MSGTSLLPGRLSTFSCAGLLLATATAWADNKPPEAPPMKPEQAQLMVYNALMGSAPAIDQCTSAYLTEYPSGVGKVVLDCVVAKDGSVAHAEAKTSLEGARNLRPCLERVAKGWKLPPIGSKEVDKLTIAVEVKKGVKFTLLKPGEKPPEPKPGASQPEPGIVQFLPKAWTEGPK